MVYGSNFTVRLYRVLWELVTLPPFFYYELLIKQARTLFMVPLLESDLEKDKLSWRTLYRNFQPMSLFLRGVLTNGQDYKLNYQKVKKKKSIEDSSQ